MADVLVVYNLGAKGVNVDLNPLQMEDNMLRKAQNAISDPLAVELGLTNRPGLTNFNPSAAAGAILGGIGVPLIDNKTGTAKNFYIGRNWTS